MYPSSSTAAHNPASSATAFFQQVSRGSEGVGLFQRVTNAISGASGGRYASLDQVGSGDISGKGIRCNVRMHALDHDCHACCAGDEDDGL